MMEYVGLLFVVVVAVGIVVYWIRTGKVEAPDDVTGVVNLLWKAMEVVRVYAPAADQLVAIGNMQKSQRLAYVMDMVQRFVPGLQLDEIRGLIEAWVAGQNKEGQ